MKKCLTIAACLLLSATTLLAQNSYRYFVDLTKVSDDRLSVELQVPRLQKPSVTFVFPKIIPGTYSIADYGRFVSQVKAFDKNNKALTVIKAGDNKWKISNATQLARITYLVDDIYDAEAKHGIYPMAATNIEQDKNFVFNTPGIFGFIEGQSKLPFELNFTKPSNFYGATALRPVSSTQTKDVFKVNNLDELYDAPIMYAVPDTTTVRVAGTDVLIAVYSPKKQIHSQEIAQWLKELLEATASYLGGKLPADKYAFIYYFKDLSLKHSFPPGLMGALEHNTSSFYYLPDVPAEQIRENIVDISSHEFFHIITPLTIASKEVKEFNFSEPVLSRHLWLYEGVTEYSSHHVQVKYGMNTVKQFLDKLSAKITDSRTNYNDTLAFTVMSKESAGKYKDEYGNVYQKGALIAAALDIYLLHLSDGKYGLRNLTYDLGVRYGRDRYFNDEELFDEIAKLSYPKVKEFFTKYVAGNQAIPYEYYFGLAGIQFTPKAERQVVSFGGIAPNINERGVLFVSPQSNLNEFGKTLGYKVGDELYAFNGVAVSPDNLGKVIDSLKKALKEGEVFEVSVGRKNAMGQLETMTLRAPVKKITEWDLNKLAPMAQPTAKQELVRKAWLTAAPVASPTPPANPADVASVDAIMKSLYEVISGPAGPRNWDRFYSLFLPGAQMGAVAQPASGEPVLRTMTPQEYKKSNGPLFMQSAFFEQELGRNITQYGNIALVQSAYQFRMSADGPVAQRGINHLSLVKSGGRWWIANLSWQSETPANPIPPQLLKPM